MSKGATEFVEVGAGGRRKAVFGEPEALGVARKATPAYTARPWLRLVFFFSLLALGAVVLDRSFTFGLRQIKTSEFGSSNRIMSGQVNAQIVISGSSRALVHYDPRVIQKITGRSAWNLGRNAAQTDMQWAFLKAYLHRNAKPQIVVHNLDPYSFVLTKELYDPAQYLPYLDEDAIYEPLRRIDPAVWKWKYLPLYGYAVEDMSFAWVKALRALMGFNPQEDYFLGYNPRALQWTGDFERFKAHNVTGVNVEIQPEAIRLLEELVQTCQSQGIQVVLVFSPEYKEMQALTKNRAEVFRKFREIAARYGVPFWDYSQAPLCENRELFYNSQHMNYRGAEIFSEDIAKRLAKFELTGHQGFAVKSPDPSVSPR
jgi:hypothetical protein